MTTMLDAIQTLLLFGTLVALARLGDELSELHRVLSGLTLTQQVDCRTDNSVDLWDIVGKR